MFTGLTAEELDRSGITELTPLQWLKRNRTSLPDNDQKQLVDYRVANSESDSAVTVTASPIGPI